MNQYTYAQPPLPIHPPMQAHMHSISGDCWRGICTAVITEGPKSSWLCLYPASLAVQRWPPLVWPLDHLLAHPGSSESNSCSSFMECVICYFCRETFHHPYLGQGTPGLSEPCLFLLMNCMITIFYFSVSFKRLPIFVVAAKASTVLSTTPFLLAHCLVLRECSLDTCLRKLMSFVRYQHLYVYI